MHVCGLISRIVYVITCYFQPKMSLLFAFASFFVVEKNYIFSLWVNSRSSLGISSCFLQFVTCITMCLWHREKNTRRKFSFSKSNIEFLYISVCSRNRETSIKRQPFNHTILCYCIFFVYILFYTFILILYSKLNCFSLYSVGKQTVNILSICISFGLILSLCLLRASDSLYVHTNNCIQIVASSGLKCVQIKK